MDRNQVITQFALLSGLSQQNAEAWGSLCDAAATRMSLMLRSDADADDPRLPLAAAGEAYYRYLLASQGGEAQSIKVGEISVSQSSSAGGLNGARTLRDELLAGAADLLECSVGGLWGMNG